MRAVVRKLWAEVDAGRSFDLSGTPFLARLPQSSASFPASSTHADRLATIRQNLSPSTA
jgi:threonine synthase